MGTIPLDILNNGILPRLPAKSLMRFKCVSKSWLALISTHEFIHHHLSHALASSTNDLFIITTADSCLYFCNADMPEAPAAKLPSLGIDPSVVGSCNGLICIQSHRPYSLVAINPSTGTSREIPALLPPRRCSALNFGFGFDSRTGDYRLVRLADRYPSLGFLGHEMNRIVHVFSFRANSWEMVEWTSPQDSMKDRENCALVKNSLLHWKFWCSEESKYRIRCFDVCDKQWTNDVLLPDSVMGSGTYSDYVQHDKDRVLDIGVLDERLYLSVKNQLQSAVDIWVMNEYGVKESWVKLFRVSDQRVFQSLRVSLIAYRSLKGRILLRTMNKTEQKILWYDIQGETVESAEFYGVADCIWIDVCKGSLVNVPGGSEIGKLRENDPKEAIS